MQQKGTKVKGKWSEGYASGTGDETFREVRAQATATR